jgi:hypothetical protein
MLITMAATACCVGIVAVMARFKYTKTLVM